MTETAISSKPVDTNADPTVAPYVEPFHAKNATYTPSEVAAYGLQAVQAIQNGKDRSMGLGIPIIEEYFAPVRPGQVAAIVGQTSHYKSGLMHLIEHACMLQLAKQGRERTAIVHISVEEDIEEQAFLEYARYGDEDAGKLARGEVKSWEKMVQVSYDIAQVPIFRIGDSLTRAELQQPMHVTNIDKALTFIKKEFKYDIAMVAIDYLQSIPMDTEARRIEDDSQRRLQVRRDAYAIRKMATKYNAPFWVPCQAKQDLGIYDNKQQGKQNGKPWLIPGMYSINESADVSQKFDRLLGVWLPSRSYPVGTVLKLGNKEIKITENLLVIKVIKQRGGLPAGRVYLCEIDFLKNSISVLQDQEVVYE